MSDSNRIPPVFLCWFVCLGSLAAYFWAVDDPVMTVGLAVIGVAGIGGYCVGGTVVLASGLMILLTVLVPAPIERAFGPAITDFFGTTGVLNRIMTVVVAAVTLGLAAMLVAEVVWNRLMEKRLNLMFYNRAIGLLLGAVQAAAVYFGILGGSVAAEPFALAATSSDVQSVHEYMQHCTADGIARLGLGARHSQVHPLLKAANPFDKIPALRELSKLSPEARAAILRQYHSKRTR